MLTTWGALVALSLSTAALTLFQLPPALVGGGILLLALAKMRLILACYLDLRRCPAWLGGFTAVLTGFTLLVFGLYLI